MPSHDDEVRSAPAISAGTFLGVMPSWDRKRTNRRLRLQPTSSASRSARTRPRPVSVRRQAWATSGATGRGHQGPEEERLRQEGVKTRAAADQRERSHQVGAEFGERGGGVAAAGVPDRDHGRRAEAVEQRRHLTRLRGHLV
ncbi:hypothetical protein GCM10009578_045870 [Streptomyces rhizosphaericus]